MGMTKLILPGSYDFGEAQTQIIKVASAGLRGDDLRSFIKRAGHKMADAMHKLALAPGEVPIHLIAIGATEYYGPNRNGDGFTEACCRKYHDTFVKHARWYRNHQNKDPKKSYGIIKYSDYNEDMHRLELIVALNGTKEAAKRNGGLVADRELEKLASGKEDWGVSMACKVAYDVCSGCGNKAHTKNDYCTAETCSYGGCRTNLCKVAEDGHILYVDNPYPTWFDISDVWRPADRIAYVFGPMQKAAGARILSSAELADELGVTAPIELELNHITDRKIREQIKLASELAAIEHDLLTTGMTKTAAPLARTEVSEDALIAASKDASTRQQLLNALAHNKVAMSLTDFVQFVSGYSREKAAALAAAVRPNLHGLFGRMCENVEELASSLVHNPFSVTDSTLSAEWNAVAKHQAKEASLNCDSLQRRAWSHAIHGETISLDLRDHGLVKEAANEGLARAYGLYKLAFLYGIRDKDPEYVLTSDLVVRQNYIYEV